MATEQPTEQLKKATFDVAVCETLRQAIVEVLARFPEVRSVACSVDYHGALNDADVSKGIWLGESGAVVSPDAVFGSVFQTLRMLETQCARSLQLMERLRENVEVLGSEAVKRHEEIQKLDEQIAKLRGLGATAATSRQKETKEGQGEA